MDGRSAALAVATLRERTGLIPAHAVQLLALADGSIDNALALFAMEPGMFNISQHSLFTLDAQWNATSATTFRDAAVAGASDAVMHQAHCAGAAPAAAALSAPVPARDAVAALRNHAPQSLSSVSCAAAPAVLPTLLPTDTGALSATTVLAPASLPSHSRSPFAKARRNKLKKQRKQLQALHAASSPNGLLPQPQVAAGHHARLARAEAIGFARGAAAEKAAAKERRGRRRIEKMTKKAGKQAGKRQARRRRAGQV